MSVLSSASAPSSDRVGRSFARSFDSYHAGALPQARIAQTLLDRLRAAGMPHVLDTVLELGCGTGHLTQGLRDRAAIRRLVLNDLCPQGRQTAQAAGAEFLEGCALDMPWPVQPQLIVSASMLQWLPRPEGLLDKAARALAPGGWLAVSSFGPAQFHELAQVAAQTCHPPGARPETAAPLHEAPLHEAGAPGLRRPQALAAALAGRMEILSLGGAPMTLVFADPMEVLRHLRRTGVNGRAGRTWTRAGLARFCAAYAQGFAAPGGGVTLTYDPVWLVARKPG